LTQLTNRKERLVIGSLARLAVRPQEVDCKVDLRCKPHKIAEAMCRVAGASTELASD